MEHNKKLADLASSLRAALRKSRKALPLVLDTPLADARGVPVTPFIVTITPDLAREYGYTADDFTYYLPGARVKQGLIFSEHLEAEISFAWLQARNIAQQRA